MSKVRVELDLKGLNELMKSPEIQASLQKAGEAVAHAAGKDYAARTHMADWIAVTNVYPTSREAVRENYSQNTLIRALGSVGLPMRK